MKSLGRKPQSHYTLRKLYKNYQYQKHKQWVTAQMVGHGGDAISVNEVQRVAVQRADRARKELSTKEVPLSVHGGEERDRASADRARRELSTKEAPQREERVESAAI
ncbi:hypothetical protein Fot_28394 [Forsythia ovata]|uniref:Uncharacterized protein n=1 Tax=Forsythia ovata TaxID=205694 RepID=A0ABD1TNV8_9LAMI